MKTLHYQFGGDHQSLLILIQLLQISFITMHNLPFLILILIALAHTDLGQGHGVELGGCLSEVRGLHPALNSGAGRRYGVPIPGYGSNYGGAAGDALGFNHGLGGVRRRRLRRPLPSFNPNEVGVALPHGFPPPVSGPIGNGIPLVDPDYPGHGPSFTPDGYPVPPQIGGGVPHNFYPPVQPNILTPPNQVIVGGGPPYGNSIANGYFGQNEHISAPPHPLVLSGTGVATPNEYQVGNTIITGDGVVLATPNGELLHPAVGRQRSFQSRTRNGLVTSNEVVVTRGGKLSSSSRSYSNRVYL